MPYVIACPHCARSISAHEGTIGQVVGCPHCRQPLTVPAPASVPTEDPNPFAIDTATTKPRYRRRQPTWSNKPLLIGLGVALVIVMLLGWYFTRTDPEVARVEAEYSELCDLIDHYGKELEKPNKEKRIRAMDPDLISAVETLKPLVDRREDLVNQFHKKYGRYPRYRKPADRDYSGAPIR